MRTLTIALTLLTLATGCATLPSPLSPPPAQAAALRAPAPARPLAAMRLVRHR